jgi:hypothetical protein
MTPIISHRFINELRSSQPVGGEQGEQADKKKN